MENIEYVNAYRDSWGYSYISRVNLPGLLCPEMEEYRDITDPNDYTRHERCAATPEEIHWLDKCIEAGRFITKKEALKDFNQEYIKIV